MRCLQNLYAFSMLEVQLRRWLVLVSTLAVSLMPGMCQTPEPSGGANHSVWLSYFGDQPFTNHLSLHLEGSYRRMLGLAQFEQVMARPGLTIMESKRWQSLFAYTYLYSEPTANGTYGLPPIVGKQPEHRAFEQQIFQHRLLGQGEHAITLQHRARLEQRWIGTEVAGVGLQDWRFSERGRYRITVHVPFGGGSNLRNYIAAFNEVYTSFGPHSTPTPFYSDVTYAAHGWKLSSHWSLEVGYQFRFQAQPGGTTGTNDHSLQIYFLSTAPLRSIRSQH